jgi:hypothetical protein
MTSELGWIGELISIISWPIFAILSLIVFAGPIRGLLKSLNLLEVVSPGFNVRFHRFIEQGEKTISDAEKINILLAESRIIETNLFIKNFEFKLPPEEIAELNKNVRALQDIVDKSKNRKMEPIQNES